MMPRRRRDASRIAGSSAATSWSGRPLGQARRHASSTRPPPRRVRAPAPARPPSPSAARHAARQRRGSRACASSSTTRCASARAIARRGPSAVRCTSAGSVSHSACQPPTARSCSCGIAASIVATSPGACTAAATASADATGLRLCGIDDDPPRPGAAGSATSPTSVCASSAMSRPILPSDAARQAQRAGDGRRAAAFAVPGHLGHAQAETCGQGVGHGRSRSAQARQRARGAAKLQIARIRRGPRPGAPARASSALDPPRGLRHRTSWAWPAAARCGRRSAWRRDARARAAAAAAATAERRQDRRRPRRPQLQHERRVHHVLAGGAPVHVPGRVRIGGDHRVSAAGPAG